METSYDFADAKVWTDEALQQRAQYLGHHLLLAAEGSARHDQMSHEIGHLFFELTARTLAEAPLVTVQ